MAGLAWLAYVPVPGLAFVPALAAPRDRAARYHAWQGGALVGLLYVGLILIGLLARASDGGGFRTFIGAIALLWILAAGAGIVVGIVGAARGRFVRVRPVWDLLAVLRR